LQKIEQRGNRNSRPSAQQG